MKNLGEGAALVLILVLANVVAGGVFALLGPLALEIADEGMQVAATVLVGVIAVACALVFLRGAVVSFVLANPNKGLESPPGRRGG